MTDNAIITAAQNIAIAINNLAKQTSAVYGSSNSQTYGGGTTNQVVSGFGRLNNVTIVVSGASKINIYDSSNISSISPLNLLASIDAINIETIFINKIYSNGIVIDIGAGVSANVTYSPL